MDTKVEESTTPSNENATSENLAATELSLSNSDVQNVKNATEEKASNPENNTIQEEKTSDSTASNNNEIKNQPGSNENLSDFPFDDSLFGSLDLPPSSSTPQTSKPPPANTDPYSSYSLNSFGSRGNRARWPNLLTELQSDDEDTQMAALTEISEFLLMVNEDSAGGFTVGKFTPIFVNLLNAEHNPNLMLASIRSLCSMMEALPASCATVVQNGAVPFLCAKLLAVTYVDISERAFDALEKLSWEHAASLLKDGALAAVLSDTLFFFDTNVQRKALITATNICRQVPVESFELVRDMLPMLSNLMSNPDKEIAESACLCLSRLTDCFYAIGPKLETISGNNVVDNVFEILTGKIKVGPKTISSMLRMLASLVRGSPTLSLVLLEKGIVTVLKSFLYSGKASLKAASTPTLANVTPEQISESLSLMDELLPILPKGVLPDVVAPRYGAPAYQSSYSRPPSYTTDPTLSSRYSLPVIAPVQIPKHTDLKSSSSGLGAKPTNVPQPTPNNPPPALETKKNQPEKVKQRTKKYQEPPKPVVDPIDEEKIPPVIPTPEVKKPIPVGPAAKKPAPGPQVKWSCSACTYLNSSFSTKCSLCHTPKSVSNQDPVGQADITSVDASEYWSCEGCTYNNPPELVQCGMCTSWRASLPPAAGSTDPSAKDLSEIKKETKNEDLTTGDNLQSSTENTQTEKPSEIKQEANQPELHQDVKDEEKQVKEEEKEVKEIEEKQEVKEEVKQEEQEIAKQTEVKEVNEEKQEVKQEVKEEVKEEVKQELKEDVQLVKEETTEDKHEVKEDIKQEEQEIGKQTEVQETEPASPSVPHKVETDTGVSSQPDTSESAVQPPSPSSATTTSSSEPAKGGVLGLLTEIRGFKKDELNDSTSTSSTAEIPVQPVKKPEPKPEPVDPRLEMIQTHAALLSSFGQQLFGVIVRIHSTTVSATVRNKCLSVIRKLIYFSPAEMLTLSLKDIALSSFLATLLEAGDNPTVVSALIMADILMEKMPDIFSRYFRKEGVVFELQRLLETLPTYPEPVDNKSKISTSSLPSDNYDDGLDSGGLAMGALFAEQDDSALPSDMSETKLPSSSSEEIIKDDTADTVPPSPASSTSNSEQDTTSKDESPAPAPKDTPSDKLNDLSSSAEQPVAQSPAVDKQADTNNTNSTSTVTSTVTSTTSASLPPSRFRQRTVPVPAATTPQNKRLPSTLVRETVKEAEITRWIATHARHFLDTHFVTSSETPSTTDNSTTTTNNNTNNNLTVNYITTDEQRNMTKLCTELALCKTSSDHSHALSVLDSISRTVGDLSTFELLGSSLIDSMLSYLTGLSAEPSLSLQDKQNDRLTRVRLFAQVFMQLHPSPEVARPFNEIAEFGTPCLKLVSGLQEALNRVENYDVEVFDALAGLTSSSGVASLKAIKCMTQSFRFSLIGPHSSTRSFPQKYLQQKTPVKQQSQEQVKENEKENEKEKEKDKGKEKEEEESEQEAKEKENILSEEKEKQDNDEILLQKHVRNILEGSVRTLLVEPLTNGSDIYEYVLSRILCPPPVQPPPAERKRTRGQQRTNNTAAAFTSGATTGASTHKPPTAAKNQEIQTLVSLYKDLSSVLQERLAEHSAAPDNTKPEPPKAILDTGIPANVDILSASEEQLASMRISLEKQLAAKDELQNADTSHLISVYRGLVQEVQQKNDDHTRSQITSLLQRTDIDKAKKLLVAAHAKVQGVQDLELADPFLAEHSDSVSDESSSEDEVGYSVSADWGLYSADSAEHQVAIDDSYPDELYEDLLDSAIQAEAEAQARALIEQELKDKETNASLEETNLNALPPSPANNNINSQDTTTTTTITTANNNNNSNTANEIIGNDISVQPSEDKTVDNILAEVAAENKDAQPFVSESPPADLSSSTTTTTSTNNTANNNVKSEVSSSAEQKEEYTVDPNVAKTHRLTLYVNNVPLDRSSTAFHFVRSLRSGPLDSVHKLWSTDYRLTYSFLPVSSLPTEDSSTSQPATTTTTTTSTTTTSTSTTTAKDEPSSFVQNVLYGSPLTAYLDVPEDIEPSDTAGKILSLLSVLFHLNRLRQHISTQQEVQAPLATSSSSSISSSSEDLTSSTHPLMIHPAEFINRKITTKVTRQLQDSLVLVSNSVPTWTRNLVSRYSFILPFDTRRQYMTSTSFGTVRALQHLYPVGRIPRQKISVSRHSLLQSAVAALERYASQKAILEVAYFSEVGVGLGPTLEFYTLLSHELQRKDLGLWLDGGSPPFDIVDDDDDDEKDSVPLVVSAEEQERERLKKEEEDKELERKKKEKEEEEKKQRELEAQDWNCVICTFINSSARTYCEMCNTRKPQPKPIQLSNSSPQKENNNNNLNESPTNININLDLEEDDEETSRMNLMFTETTSKPMPIGARKKNVEDRIYVFNKGGLWPSPLFKNDSNKENILKYFSFAGRFVAKSFMDGRLIDLPLSNTFIKWMLNEPLTLLDLKALNEDVVRSLDKFVPICKVKRDIQLNSSLSFDQKQQQIDSLLFEGVKIEDLFIDFTLPGFPSYELIPNGADEIVSAKNIDFYVERVVDVFLREGVREQLEHFKAGFEEVFCMDALRGRFSVFETETMLCGLNSVLPWTCQDLEKHIKCDHGYAVTSRTVRNLLEIMTELNSDEQREFLLFVTGSPKLPLGGWKALNPKMTVVRKDLDFADEYLPSVMTCVNYLKLPDYSSKALLKEKLKMAMREGGGEFHLS